MKVYNSIEEYAKTACDSQVALGFFDGVHLGHRAVISDCIADKGDRQAVVLTFFESPARLLGNSDIRLITDNPRKAQLIEALGADALIFADFAELKNMEPEDFIADILRGKLHAKKVSCGYNYRFGRFGRGDTAILKSECEKRGISASVKAPVYLDGQSVSSTAVRELMQSGRIDEANKMLGCPYAVSGRIGSGNRMGSQMGFPTLNLPIGEGLAVPRCGVYASRVTVGGKSYRGATNIGVHPTVGDNDAPLCETFLLDYHGEALYGADATCELIRFIRPEQRFSSTDELIAQIGRDVEKIKSI
jgi:riboflavin kinase/FMN adenylyltransferase